MRAIVRYADRRQRVVRVGVRHDDTVTPLEVPDVASLLRLPAADLFAALDETAGPPLSLDQVVLLPPVDGATEVWAAGVTYERSRTAREEESAVASVYEMVYDAARPELFFKAPAWRVVTDGEPIGIRRDSELDVPEAELALVLNAGGDIVGYTICNDVSSRSIEGANPLYLPQAKVYAGSCALAPGIRPATDVADPSRLGIRLQVVRQDRVAWTGASSTASMHRIFGDLARWLFAELAFPAGAVLATGTGIVPEMAFSLEDGDVVTIEIDGVGRLSNVVTSGSQPFDCLTPTPDDPLARPSAQGSAVQPG